MAEERMRERAYVLRLWREGTQWRASLLVTATGERHGFGSLEGLLAFLRAETGPDPPRARGDEKA
ncbi:MAG TPA: hypothetical protein VFW96_15565 [Thermomicrobiales bacterium]|nr:hypothetical protein [Thermomicrobiales bacterium]